MVQDHDIEGLADIAEGLEDPEEKVEKKIKPLLLVLGYQIEIALEKEQLAIDLKDLEELQKKLIEMHQLNHLKYLLIKEMEEELNHTT